MKKLLIVLTVLAATWTACGNKKSAPADGNSSPATEKNAENTDGPVHLTKATFITKVWDYNSSPQEWKFKGSKPAIIDFYADWCGPCKIAAPILDEIAKEYAGKIDVYKIDTQNEQELASVFGIQSIPAFLYIPASGKPVMTAGIGRSKEDTRKMFIDAINEYLLKTPDK